MTQVQSKQQLFLNWGKCQGGNWCPLNTVDLSNAVFNGSGVYAIWHEGSNPKWVYVGQGDLRDRLTTHRTDKRIQVYKDKGLKVTWAKVPAAKHNGVEAYLAAKLKPLVGDRHPVATQIVVNLPGK